MIWQARGQLPLPSVTLKIMAASLEKLLDTQQLAQAYILSGAQATDVARQFIQKLFCESQCGSCEQCQKLVSGNHSDVRWVAPDGKNIKIDQIRNLQRTALYPPIEAPHKVFVIQSAETLSQEAANSLLKILETPPTFLIFMLLTQRLGDLLPTVVSRCRVVNTGVQDLSEDIERACWGNSAWMQTFTIDDEDPFELNEENLLEAFSQTQLVPLYQATQKVFQYVRTLPLSQVLKMAAALSKSDRSQLEYLLQGLAYLSHDADANSVAGLELTRQLSQSYGALRSNANAQLLLETCLIKLWKIHRNAQH